MCVCVCVHVCVCVCVCVCEVSTLCTADHVHEKPMASSQFLLL